LGGLGPDFPVGQALSAAYEIDKSGMTVTIDGLPALIAYAGAIAPGLYQLNVTVPAVQHSGDVSIALTAGGKAAQSGAKLAVRAQ
jgi:uncharacterized protein (TIGR03437 family)